MVAGSPVDYRTDYKIAYHHWWWYAIYTSTVSLTLSLCEVSGSEPEPIKGKRGHITIRWGYPFDTLIMALFRKDQAQEKSPGVKLDPSRIQTVVSYDSHWPDLASSGCKSLSTLLLYCSRVNTEFVATALARTREERFVERAYYLLVWPEKWWGMWKAKRLTWKLTWTPSLASKSRRCHAIFIL